MSSIADDFSEQQIVVITALEKALARCKSAGLPLSAFQGSAAIAFPNKEQSLSLDAIRRALRRAETEDVEMRIDDSSPLVVNLARPNTPAHRVAY